MKVGRFLWIVALAGPWAGTPGVCDTSRAEARATPTPRAEENERERGGSDEGSIKRLFRGIGKSEKARDRDAEDAGRPRRDEAEADGDDKKRDDRGSSAKRRREPEGKERRDDGGGRKAD